VGLGTDVETGLTAQAPGLASQALGSSAEYVEQYVDRTGKLRRYFRKGGKRLGALPGAVGSEEFMAAYAAFAAFRSPRGNARRRR
jgi:hypothetical protein